MKKLLISEDGMSKEIIALYGRNHPYTGGTPPSFPIRRLYSQVSDKTEIIYDMLWDNDSNWPFNTNIKNPYTDTSYGVTNKKTIMKQIVSSSTHIFFYCLERINSVNTYKIYENEIGTNVYTEIRSGPLGHESVMRIVFDTLYIAITPGEYVVRYDGGGTWTTIGTNSLQGRYIFEITHLNGNLIRNVEGLVEYWNGTVWTSYNLSPTGMTKVKHHDGYLYGRGNSPYLNVYRYNGTTKTVVTGFAGTPLVLLQSGGRLFAVDSNYGLYEISGTTATQLGTETGFSTSSDVIVTDGLIYAIKNDSWNIYVWDGSSWELIPYFECKEYHDIMYSWAKLVLCNGSVVVYNTGEYGVLFYDSTRNMFMPLGFPGQFYTDQLYPYNWRPVYTEGTSLVYSSGEKIMYFDAQGGNQIWNKPLPFQELT